MSNIDFGFFSSLKGEFEAEGLSRINIAAEALFAARHGLDYLVKIGGCEAKADLYYLADLGVSSIVAPMIETPFAMQKYMEMLLDGHFQHVGVTIETTTAVENIEGILDSGVKLTEVTIGRTDLTASYQGTSVDSADTMEMVKKVAKAAKARGLKVTMGGSVNKKTREFLLQQQEFRNLLDCVETRKAAMPVDKFLDDRALGEALKLEALLLDMRAQGPERVLPALHARKSAITSRV